MADLNVYASALELYKFDHHDYPDAENWHSDLVESGIDIKLVKDPWGDPYVYEKRIEGSQAIVRLYSINRDPNDPSQVITLTCMVSD